MPKTKDAALDAFLAAKIEIDVMLARLATQSADHFGYSTDDVTWGHVGTLVHHRARLREIIDMAFRKGQHAARKSTTHAQEAANALLITQGAPAP